MYSVSQRARTYKQPRGGYLRHKDFVTTTYECESHLFPNENINPSLVGMTVDYMTRHQMGSPLDNVFRISLSGAARIHQADSAKSLMNGITNLDDDSIINACKLVGYDVCFRAGPSAFRPIENIHPDANTIFNIRTMINRSITFWEENGPIIKDGFTFEGGYTDIISSGDGDFLTENTLWDFKVSKDIPKSRYRLQLLIYYIMGCHSVHSEFQNVHYLGLFNPRLNTSYVIDVRTIDKKIINEVSTEVIGYK